MSRDDGLREAIALAICPGTYCESHGECLEDAAAVLALPEVAALRAKAAAADRARELAEEWGADGDARFATNRIARQTAAREIRRALDGQP